MRLGDSAGITACQNAVGGVEGGDDNQCIEGQHHKGVDEHTDHGNAALLMGILDVGQRMGMGGGAHTGFVGEQAALCALRNCNFNGCTKATADNGLGLECILEDHCEGGGNVLDPHNQNEQTAQQEQCRHNGDDLLSDGGQTADTAQEDDGTDDNQHNAYNPGGDTKGVLEGGADGVGLHHAAKEA